MFQKSPICLKKRPICCPYVVLSEGFSSPYVEKAPYVANQVPICGPYAAHMWPICFGCSRAIVFRLWTHMGPCHYRLFGAMIPGCLIPNDQNTAQTQTTFRQHSVVYCTMFVFVSHRPLSLVIIFLYSFVIVSFYVHSYWSAESYLSVLFLSIFSCPLVPSLSLCPCPCQCLGSACSI